MSSWSPPIADPAARIEALHRRGVRVVDPRQVFVDEDVSLGRVEPGAVLHPGTRLHGARTFVGEGAEVGREGPATLVNAVLARGAAVDAGVVRDAVLLDRATLGWGAHVRAGTILEEEASTAHVVGLKHSILLPFVTLGSLINFCDALIAGGTSRQDHSEVGSGFIHFNFTPWGARGDKATPSLVGDVVQGVFLRQPRIFLGGSSGMVGPNRVGFGAVTGAGQVVRQPVPAGQLSVEAARATRTRRPRAHLDPLEPRRERNVDYLAQLVALRFWYEEVRLRRLRHLAEDDPRLIPTLEARRTLDVCVHERLVRLTAFNDERNGAPLGSIELQAVEPCPLPLDRDLALDHVTWVQSLTVDEMSAGERWLLEIAQRCHEQLLRGA